MHLPSQSDSGDWLTRFWSGSKRTFNGFLCGAPPVGWFLLGPCWPRRRERNVTRGRRRNDVASGVNDNRARAAGADVDAENRNGETPSDAFACV